MYQEKQEDFVLIKYKITISKVTKKIIDKLKFSYTILFGQYLKPIFEKDFSLYEFSSDLIELNKIGEITIQGILPLLEKEYMLKDDSYAKLNELRSSLVFSFLKY